jgi:repressor LexA
MTTETVPVPDTKPPLPPTPRQLEILAFIESRQRLTGPTIREICREFGFRSPHGAVCHLDALEKKGLIRRLPNVSRGIEVLR